MMYFGDTKEIDFQTIVNSPWTINIATGLIVTIVGGMILYFIYKHFDRKQKELEKKFSTQSEINEFKDETLNKKVVKNERDLDRLTPINSTGYEIVQKINEYAPYVREEAEQAYVDQQIKLEVKFRDLGKVVGSTDRVRLYSVSKEGYPWVHGIVSLKKYPWLKTLAEDTLIDVEGTITRFHGHEIELKNMIVKQK